MMVTLDMNVSEGGEGRKSFPEEVIQPKLGAEVESVLGGARSPFWNEGLWQRSLPTPRSPNRDSATLLPTLAIQIITESEELESTSGAPPSPKP